MMMNKNPEHFFDKALVKYKKNQQNKKKLRLLYLNSLITLLLFY